MSSLDPADRASFDRVQTVIDSIAPEWLEDDNILQISPCL